MKNCPTCKQPVKKKFSNGGDSGEGSEPTAEDTAAMEGGDEEAPSPQEGSEATPEDTAAMEGGDEEETPTPPPATEGLAIHPRPAGIPPPPEHPSVAGTIDIVAPPRRPDFVGTGGRDYNLSVPELPTPPAPTAQQMNADDLGYASDLKMGKITPKTYGDLFHKEDTLGKIGSFFGLLISGMGSGLAHQPNMVMEMMNKEIERDLDAQKTSNSNAQNWYRLSLGHELQKAQINKMAYENAYQSALTGKVPYEQEQLMAATEAQLGNAYQQATAADFERAKISKLGGGTFDLSASNAARNKMMLAAQQHLQDLANKLPPAVQPQAQAVLNTQIGPAIGSSIANNNAKTAGQLSLLNKGRNGMGPSVDPSVYGQQLKAAAAQPHAVNYGKLQSMIGDTRNRAALGLPPAQGGITEADYNKINDEAQELEDNRVVAGMYNHAFTKLNQQLDKGSLNKQMYMAETGTLAPEVARATAGRFNLTESEKQSGGLFPSWEDYLSGAGTEKYNNAMNYFKGKENKTSMLNGHPELKTPFPAYASPFAKKGLKEGTLGKDINGRPTIVRNGKVVYK